jgi:hypothetical protein
MNSEINQVFFAMSFGTISDGEKGKWEKRKD